MTDRLSNTADNIMHIMLQRDFSNLSKNFFAYGEINGLPIIYKEVICTIRVTEKISYVLMNLQ